jgi:hypothetical protein
VAPRAEGGTAAPGGTVAGAELHAPRELHKRRESRRRTEDAPFSRDDDEAPPGRHHHRSRSPSRYTFEGAGEESLARLRARASERARLMGLSVFERQSVDQRMRLEALAAREREDEYALHHRRRPARLIAQVRKSTGDGAPSFLKPTAAFLLRVRELEEGAAAAGVAAALAGEGGDVPLRRTWSEPPLSPIRQSRRYRHASQSVLSLPEAARQARTAEQQADDGDDDETSDELPGSLPAIARSRKHLAADAPQGQGGGESSPFMRAVQRTPRERKSGSHIQPLDGGADGGQGLSADGAQGLSSTQQHADERSVYRSDALGARGRAQALLEARRQQLLSASNAKVSPNDPRWVLDVSEDEAAAMAHSSDDQAGAAGGARRRALTAARAASERSRSLERLAADAPGGRRAEELCEEQQEASTPHLHVALTHGSEMLPTVVPVTLHVVGAREEGALRLQEARAHAQQSSKRASPERIRGKMEAQAIPPEIVLSPRALQAMRESAELAARSFGVVLVGAGNPHLAEAPTAVPPPVAASDARNAQSTTPREELAESRRRQPASQPRTLHLASVSPMAPPRVEQPPPRVRQPVRMEHQSLGHDSQQQPEQQPASAPHTAPQSATAHQLAVAPNPAPPLAAEAGAHRTTDQKSAPAASARVQFAGPTGTLLDATDSSPDAAQPPRADLAGAPRATAPSAAAATMALTTTAPPLAAAAPPEAAAPASEPVQARSAEATFPQTRSQPPEPARRESNPLLSVRAPEAPAAAQQAQQTADEAATAHPTPAEAGRAPSADSARDTPAEPEQTGTRRRLSKATAEAAAAVALLDSRSSEITSSSTHLPELKMASVSASASLAEQRRRRRLPDEEQIRLPEINRTANPAFSEEGAHGFTNFGFRIEQTRRSSQVERDALAAAARAGQQARVARLARQDEGVDEGNEEPFGVSTAAGPPAQDEQYDLLFP